MLTNPAAPFAASVATHAATWQRKVALAALGLVALATWMLQHPYHGIQDDAVLYTLFGLARLHPDSLRADVFLRFGSQDNYSLFAPLYAMTIRVFGMEHAAQLLVVLSQAALLGCVWKLARRFTTPLNATLGLALVLTVPGEYGMGSTFGFLENIITARLPAEACVLAALLAAVRQRFGLATGCIVVSMLIHPIMGAAGATCLVLTFLVPRHPRTTLSAIAVGFLAMLAIVIAVAPLGRVMDRDWMFVIHTTANYLFVTAWSVFDWSRACAYLVILAVGARVGSTPLLRQLCTGALATAACGLALSLVFCDGLHVSIFIDMQAWRWLWLADLLAIALAPVIFLDCWQRGMAGRTAVAVFGAACIFRELPPLGLVLDVAVLACAIVPAQWTGHRYWKLLFVAACTLTGLAFCLSVSTSSTYAPESISYTPDWLQTIRGLCSSGIIPAAVLLASWWAAPRAALAFALCAGALVCVLLPFAWLSYTGEYYSAQRLALFAPWRAAIPTQAEVLWLENPVGTWYLLERPSYLSGQQVAGAIFSRDKAVLIERRSERLAASVRASGMKLDSRLRDKSMQPLNVRRLNLSAMRDLCKDPDLGYLVNWDAPVPSPWPALSLDASKPDEKIHLYRCSDLRT